MSRQQTSGAPGDGDSSPGDGRSRRQPREGSEVDLGLPGGTVLLQGDASYTGDGAWARPRLASPPRGSARGPAAGGRARAAENGSGAASAR